MRGGVRVKRLDVDDFRADARSWLATRLTPRPATAQQWGEGSDSVAVFRNLDADAQARHDAEVRAWHRDKLAAGWAGLSWPERFGGQGLPALYDQVFAEEEARFDAPVEHEVFGVTVRLVAPTLELFGTPEQQDAYVERFLRAESLCCQLFSEPDAGSDLASLRCTATPTEGGWRIRGQKVWTSGAQLCDFGLLLARSEPDAPQHHGITAFLLPLNTPGVDIRPIRQMTGGAAFNHVFLDDVLVDDELRIGGRGDGWDVALTTLGFERSSSADGAGGVGGSPQQVRTLASHLRADAVARQDVAHLYALGRIGELAAQRARGALAAGDDPGPVGSVGKLFWTQRLTHTSATVSRLLGPKLAADTGEWGTYAWREHVLGAPGYRIAGGSDEIQRNIIGEKVLGLPREPRN